MNARTRIAEATRDVHEALHHHPHIGLLTSDKLTESTYRTILNAYTAFYKAAEIRRTELEVWDHFSLQTAVAALEKDTNHAEVSMNSVDFTWVEGPLDCLAVLYVLHGSGMGGRQIARHVSKRLPGVPISFLRSGMDVPVWKHLLETLNVSADHPSACSKVIDAARKTFQQFGAWVTLYCNQKRIAGRAGSPFSINTETEPGLL